MRRYLTSLVVLASLVSAGCVQSSIVVPSDPGPAKDAVEVSLVVEDSDHIVWKEGDAVSVVSSADTRTCSKFVVKSKEGTTATLSGSIVEGSALCAVYPYDENCSMTVDGPMFLISTNIPADQTEEQQADVYVAVADEGRLVFSPSSAKVKVTVAVDGPAEEFTEVSIVGNNGENLAGTVRIMAFAGGDPVMMAPTASEGTASVLKGRWTVSADKPLELEFGVAPAMLDGGYSISVTKSDGISSLKEYAEGVSLRSNITTELDKFVFEGPKYYFIYTADKMLDLKGYKNDYDPDTGTGRLWMNTAEIPDGILTGNTDIKGVHIPAFITEIGAAAFQNCTSLSSLTFEEGSSLEVIRTQAFQKTALVRISFPASLKEVEVQGFQGTASLRGISFPADSKLEKLQQGAFNGSTKIDDPLVLPASIKFMDRCFNVNYNPKISPTILATTPPELGNDGKGVFNVNGLNKIYVPKESLEAYKAAWTTYTKYFAAIP